MIYFLMPAFNEEENLKGVISSISLNLRQPHQFIVVNDGSTDDTSSLLIKLAEKYPIVVISHQMNQGVLQSFIDGFEMFLNLANSSDILITMEADNTSCVKILEQMIGELSKYDVVLASCYLKDGAIINTNLSRRIISACANFLMRFVFPELRKISTVSSFYRSFRYDIIATYWDFYKDQRLTEDSFACVIEMLIKLKRMNASIIEVPMVLDTGNRAGISKMPKFKTFLGYLNVIIGLKFKSFKFKTNSEN